MGFSKESLTSCCWISKKGNPEKLAKYKKKKKTKQKYNIICVGHHYAQTNRNNVYKT